MASRFLVLLGLLPALVVPTSAEAHPTPAIQKAWSARASYRQKAGKLFANSISGDEVVQGTAGDCYFLSPLAGLAHVAPVSVQRSIAANQDGSVSVRLYRRDRKSGRYRRVKVHVDTELPHFGGGELLNARSRNRTELWVSLVEKAYARLQRDYDGIGGGGLVDDAIGALTGRSSRWLRVREHGSDRLYDTLRQALSTGKIAVASTFSSDDFREAGTRRLLQATRVRTGVRLLGERKRPSYTGTGLWPAHAYTVWKVFERDGRRWVTLRDPYGHKPAADGAPSTERRRGIFTLPFERFLLLYEDVHVGR